jgi:hypothetical protein
MHCSEFVVLIRTKLACPIACPYPTLYRSAAMGKEQALKHMRECDDSSSSSSAASAAQHQSLGAQLRSLFSCSSSSSKNGDDDNDQVAGSASNNSNASNSAANRLVLKPESPARQLWCSSTVGSDPKGGIMHSPIIASV